MADPSYPVTDREQVERGGKAAFLAFQHDITVGGRLSWEDAPEDMRITFRMVADAVLMTAQPAPEVERRMAEWHAMSPAERAAWSAGYAAALATHPTKGEGTDG